MDHQPQWDFESKMASSRSLYHGTLIDHMPDIERSGLQPGVGGFTSDAYDLDEDGNYKQGPNAEDQYSPAELGIRPVVFMADKKRLDHSLNAIRHNVANKLGKGFHDITPQDVQDHGLLVKYKGQMGKQDPPANYVYDEQHEEPFENLHDKGTHPYQAEPGDFYSESPITNLQYIHGPAMMRVFKQNGSLPWSTPFGQEQQELEALRASSWNFVSAHQLNWTPGNEGKGLVAPDGSIHTWNVDDGQAPHHTEYLEEMGIDPWHPETGELRDDVMDAISSFDISPEGLHHGPLGLEKVDPRLRKRPQAWNFQSATQHQLGWQPGQWGKGLVHNGSIHTWNTGVYDGQPTHPQYAEQKLGLSPEEWLSDNKNNGFSTAFQVHPDGKVRFWDPVDNDLRDLVQSAHPHFDTYASPYDSAWNFQTKARVVIPDWNFQSNTTGTYHFNPWSGAFCTCPYSALHRKMQRYAGMYINKVLKAPDKALRTPEGEAFKKHLVEHLPEEHESLAPWLAHRFKQGDIRLSADPIAQGPGQPDAHDLEWWDKAVPKTNFDHAWNDILQNGASPDRFNEKKKAESNQFKPLYPAELDRWHAWYEAKQHPLRKGVNVMDKNFTPFEMSQVGNKHWKALQEQQQLDEYSHRGSTVHTFPASNGGDQYGNKIDWDSVEDNEGPESDGQGIDLQRIQHLKEVEEWANEKDDSVLQPSEKEELEELRGMYPKQTTPRPAGWHIKELRNAEDAEAEGHMMGHCFGSEEQPYGRCLDNGDITAYSLRDPKGKPHVTWHYNSDGSLAEMFGPNDDPIKPEYQEMLNEWGNQENVRKDTNEDEAEGMQEQAEDPIVTLPSAENMNDYVSYHHPEYRVDSAEQMEGTIGPQTEIENDSPNWEAIASDYLDKSPGRDVNQQQEHDTYMNEFHDALGENPGDHSLNAIQDMDEALRDKVQKEFPHWPQLDQNERDELPDHWRENLHRWDNWYNKPQQVNPWQFPSDLNHPTTPAMDPNINDHQIQMPIPSSDPAPTANSWGYQSSWITAPIIDDMRDGLGRFAVAAPWQPGSSGKGLYFPETGVLQTWSDDRTHPDVLFDDENAKSGNAHHIIIRPNGTVRDQGCLDKDFADADGDVEGLHKALSELDPRLRLDAPNTWDFGGPTEPVEEEPSSVSRGEDGGSVHGVQTSGDYAGSL